ncbi:MAG: DedA family protein [Myxococcales bacterium]|nr:DedA family protein [Myxococcales bacterium]
MELTALLEWLRTHEGPGGYGFLGLSAMLEYVVPPFPGDTVTLFGVFLAVTAGYSMVWVYLMLTAGSVMGGVLSYGIGLWLGAEEGRLGRWVSNPRLRRGVTVVRQRFERRGAIYLAVNRFLPVLRGVFFIAAGMARMRLWQVVVYGLISALAWNGLIVAVGYSVGANWQALYSLYHQYTLAVVAVLALLLLGWWLLKRWRRDCNTV